MKAFTLIFLSSFAFFLCQANIINGYEMELKQAAQSLNNLTELIHNATDKDNEKSYKLKSHYLRAKQTYKHVSTYYDLTEEVIISLKIRHASFYYDLHEIKNHRQQITDVYVQVVPEDLMKPSQFGTTNLAQSKTDPHQYQSSFGLNTVSVKIRDCSPAKMLRLLVHELGHVKYQVPNLASYMSYYQKKYQGFREIKALGHLKDDPSNQTVIAELNAFNAAMRID